MTAIEHIVLRRVHRIHFLRRVLGATALKAYGLLAFALGLFSSVSVASVYANMAGLGAPTQMGRYLLGALVHTDWLVKLLVFGMFVAAGMLLRDILRGFSGRVLLPFVRV